jgi:endonuclease YncB( thermonuclease family)
MATMKLHHHGRLELPTGPLRAVGTQTGGTVEVTPRAGGGVVLRAKGGKDAPRVPRVADPAPAGPAAGNAPSRSSATLAAIRSAVVAGALLLGGANVGAADRAVVDGLATVQQDGSLHVGGETVRLFGADIPGIEPTCRFVVRPPRCAARSMLVLDGLVTGFVRCEILRHGGGGPEGVCTVAGRDLFGPREDLGAALILDGWALATPAAPEQYHALEAVARSREAGLWGDKIVNFR